MPDHRFAREALARDRAIADRLAELLAGPDLRGLRPACAGRSPLFDLEVVGESSDERDERLAAARAVCSACAALEPCRAIRDNPPSGLVGVWGGELLGRPKPRRAPLTSKGTHP